MINIIKSWEDYIEKNLLELLGDKPEGNLYSRHLTKNKENAMIPKQINIIKFLKTFQPKNILEIGFNAGFSTLLIKKTNPEIKITSIDINEHPYVLPCYKKISQDYKDIKLILENSLTALPKLILSNLSFDAIHIDGDHSIKTAEKDFIYCLKLSKKNSVIIVDDTNLNHINQLCDYYIQKEIVKEFKFEKENCNKYQHRFLEVL